MLLPTKNIDLTIVIKSEKEGYDRTRHRAVW